MHASQAGGFWPYASVLSPHLVSVENSHVQLLSAVDSYGKLNLIGADIEEETAVTSIFFKELIKDYLFIEVDVISLTPAATPSLQVTGLGTYSIEVGQLFHAILPVGSDSVRTYRFPYCGPLRGFKFVGFTDTLFVQVSDIRIFYNPPNLETETAAEIVAESENSASVQTAGNIIRHPNGIWDLLIPGGATVTGTFRFTSDGVDYSNGLIRVSRQQEPGLADFKLFLEDQVSLPYPNLYILSNYAEVWVDSQHLEIDFAVENISPDTELSVQIMLELFKAWAPSNAFEVDLL